MAGEKPYTPWNMQHNHLSPAAVKAGLGPMGWHTLREHLPRHAFRQLDSNAFLRRFIAFHHDAARPADRSGRSAR